MHGVACLLVVYARTYIHWTAARVAQQGQLSTRGIGYFRLSVGCRQYRRHFDTIFHDMYV